MINYIAIGKKLREARLAKRLTQTELASELGVSIGYISQIESGDKCFNLKRLEEVSDILGKPVGYFLSGATLDENNSIIDEILEIMSRLPNDEFEKANRILKIIVE